MLIKKKAIDIFLDWSALLDYRILVLKYLGVRYRCYLWKIKASVDDLTIRGVRRI